MKHNYTFLTFLLLLVTLAFASCSDKDEKVPPFLTIDNKTLNFSSDATSRVIDVKTSIDQWQASVGSSASSWLSTSKQGSKLRISLTENTEQDSRKGTITVTAGTLSEIIEVEQMGVAPAILVGSEIYTVSSDGESINLEITSNIEYDIIIPSDADWIVENKNKSTRLEMVTTNHVLDVEWNTENVERQAEIIVKQKDGDLQKKVLIIQKPQSGYAGGNTDDIKDDVKVKISGGWADSFQPGSGDIEKSFDGDMNTLYHSNWSNGGSNYFPITIEYYFEDVEYIDYLIYHPRTSGGNGHFKETEIWVAANGAEVPVKLMDFDFKGSGSATKIIFDEPLQNPTTVRFVIKSGAGDGQGFASCAEMEFYQTNPNNYDPLNIFTDETCSELKPGITMVDIEKIEETLYRNIAFYLFNDTYPSEFRVQEFKAWPHPDNWARENKTSTLSLLDNPTGISVSAGEDLVVFVGETHNRQISLKVQDLNKPEGDGYNQASYYPLSKGVNKLKMNNKGLAYLFYHTDDYATAPKIKIHFATGRVNGYFDSQKHKASDWKRIIGGAVDEYFDILGKHAHITFTTEMFRTYTPDAKTLIDAYDDLVDIQKEFMGLYKYNRDPVNRNYFNAMYGSYMYATSYRTSYNISGEEIRRLMADVTQFKKDTWGPAHEVGHTFQTRPGFRWLGMTEVTNNVKSLLVQTKWGNASRLEDENMGRYNNRYEKAYHNSFVNKIPHPGEEDVFCKLVSLWQLQLYFGKAKGQADTYADLYEKVRTTSNLPSAGLQQLEFVKMMSDITKTDLIGFFKKWGYLSEFDKELDDYGKARFTVEKDDIDKTIAYVKGKGYPDISEKLEYICDSNWEIFRDKKAVQKGTATVSGTSVEMSNWKNVVAYEVYEGDRLVFASNYPSFTLNSGVSSNTKIYALAYDGTKTEVNY